MSRMLADMRIGWKLTVAPAAAFFALVALAAGIYLLLGSLRTDIRYLNDVAFGKVLQAAELDKAIGKAQARLYELTAFAANSPDAEGVARRRQILTRAFEDVAAAQHSMSPAPATAGLIAAWRKSAN